MKRAYLTTILVLVSTPMFSQRSKPAVPFIATCMTQFQKYYDTKKSLELAMDFANCKKSWEQCNQKLKSSYNRFLLTMESIESDLTNLKEVDVELNYRNTYLSFFKEIKTNYLTHYPLLIDQMKHYGTPRMNSKQYLETFLNFSHKDRTILEKYSERLTTDRFFKKYGITPLMLKEYLKKNNISQSKEFLIFNGKLLVSSTIKPYEEDAKNTVSKLALTSYADIKKYSFPTLFRKGIISITVAELKEVDSSLSAIKQLNEIISMNESLDAFTVNYDKPTAIETAFFSGYWTKGKLTIKGEESSNMYLNVLEDKKMIITTVAVYDDAKDIETIHELINSLRKKY